MERMLQEAVHGFLFNRAEQERTAKTRDSYKDVVKRLIMTDGREDENGSRWLDFDEPLTIEGKSYRGIQAQRRLSSSIDLDATEELVRAKGLYNDVFPVVEVRQFHEDRLYAANQQGLISDAELDSLITENVTYAVVPVKS